MSTLGERGGGAGVLLTAKDLRAPVRAPKQDPWWKRWPLAMWLAVLVVPFLLWEVWTVVAWLADRPHFITQFQDRDSASWYAAKVYESLALLMTIVMAIYVVRGCRRERKVFTFDVLFCGAAITGVWAGFGSAFFQPHFLGSSNFVAVNAMCGHMPLIANPDCGRHADAFFYWMASCPGLLAAALVGEAVMRRIRRRWPDISTTKLILALFGFGAAVDIAFELPAISLGLWTYPPGPLALPLGNYRYPAAALFAGMCFFAMPVLVRGFKDDRGHTPLERGIQHLRPRYRTVVLWLALVFAVQFVNWATGVWPFWAMQPYGRPFPDLPAHVMNDVCDTPGKAGTRYGPCPGSPGFRMPGRQSDLPGKSP